MPPYGNRPGSTSHSRGPVPRQLSLEPKGIFVIPIFLTQRRVKTKKKKIHSPLLGNNFLILLRSRGHSHRRRPDRGNNLCTDTRSRSSSSAGASRGFRGPGSPEEVAYQNRGDRNPVLSRTTVQASLCSLR